MKSIKEYITEGLFDDEDDLLDKKPDQAMINWLEENTSLEYALKHNRSKVNNGKVYIDPSTNWSSVAVKSNPPKWINFDKKSWEEQAINIKYSIKSQKDINNTCKSVLFF